MRMIMKIYICMRICMHKRICMIRIRIRIDIDI